jgi:hypothetical protein
MSSFHGASRGFAHLRRLSLALRAPSVTRAHASSYPVALVPLLVSLLGGCGVPANECEVGQTQCDGNTIMECEPIETGDGTYQGWRSYSCDPGICQTPASGGALCALSSDPDPKCDGRESYCDGSARISCRAGYATASEDCASGLDTPFCADISPDPQMAIQTLSALCVAESTRNPECPTVLTEGVQGYDSSACVGKELLHCIDGYIVSRQSCGT